MYTLMIRKEKKNTKAQSLARLRATSWLSFYLSHSRALFRLTGLCSQLQPQFSQPKHDDGARFPDWRLAR